MGIALDTSELTTDIPSLIVESESTTVTGTDTISTEHTAPLLKKHRLPAFLSERSRIRENGTEFRLNSDKSLPLELLDLEKEQIEKNVVYSTDQIAVLAKRMENPEDTDVSRFFEMTRFKPDGQFDVMTFDSRDLTQWQHQDQSFLMLTTYKLLDDDTMIPGSLKILRYAEGLDAWEEIKLKKGVGLQTTQERTHRSPRPQRLLTSGDTLVE